MRFYLDEDLSPRVAEIARAYGLDVISSHECGRNSLPDEDQLRLAAQEGRCVVTRNRDDFIELTTAFMARLEPHAGVLIVPSSLANRGPSALARALLAFSRRYERDMEPYTLMFLSPE